MFCYDTLGLKELMSSSDVVEGVVKGKLNVALLSWPTSYQVVNTYDTIIYSWVGGFQNLKPESKSFYCH
jgi:hypothetical protein